MTVSDDECVDSSKAPNIVNKYLAIREAKMARNQARLEALGLLQPNASNTTVNSTFPRKSKKRKRIDQNSSNVQSQSLRKSSRLQSLSPGIIEMESKPDTTSIACTKPLENKSRRSPSADVTIQQRNEERFCHNSARAIELCVPKLIHNFLGIQLSATGKAHVMLESARVAARVSEHSTHTAPSSLTTISFNKYSGIQEWKGDTIFLWINLVSTQKKNKNNEFLNNGRQVRFYGGARMHRNTRVIQHLVRITSQQAAKQRDTAAIEGGVLLWCRQHCDEFAALGPYVCLGRLSVRDIKA